MTRRLSFPGFEELVRRPLEKSDPFSYARIVRVLERAPDHAAPFAYLLGRMVGKRFTPEESRMHWERIIALKNEMERKLGWTVDIQTATVEYFSRQKRHLESPSATQPVSVSIPVITTSRVPPEAPEYPLARLKEEIQRSRRYKHALSAIMLDAGWSDQNGNYLDEAIEMARVIERTIRAVDILAHCGGTRFLIILPNTNYREAEELAERVIRNLGLRERVAGALSVKTVRIAVSQWSSEIGAAAFVAALQSRLHPP